MQVGDLVKFTDDFGNDVRILLVAVIDQKYAKVTNGLTTFWSNLKDLEIINASR